MLVTGTIHTWWTCSMCSSTFPSKGGMRSHATRVHDGHLSFTTSTSDPPHIATPSALNDKEVVSYYNSYGNYFKHHLIPFLLTCSSSTSDLEIKKTTYIDRNPCFTHLLGTCLPLRGHALIMWTALIWAVRSTTHNTSTYAASKDSWTVHQHRHCLLNYLHMRVSFLIVNESACSMSSPTAGAVQWLHNRIVKNNATCFRCPFKLLRSSFLRNCVQFSVIPFKIEYNYKTERLYRSPLGSRLYESYNGNVSTAQLRS